MKYIWLLHEPEKLNSLIETLFDLGIIGRSNSLEAYTIVRADTGLRCGWSVNKQNDLRKDASRLKRSLKQINRDPSNCHIQSSSAILKPEGCSYHLASRTSRRCC